MKLIVGLRGSGKTKMLVDLVNSAQAESKGDVICVAYDDQLKYDIKPQVRLINVTDYDILDAEKLYGFVAGLLASNFDLTHIFIDAAFKICNYDMKAFEEAVLKLNKIAAECDITMTVSVDPLQIPDSLKEFI